MTDTPAVRRYPWRRTAEGPAPTGGSLSNLASRGAFQSVVSDLLTLTEHHDGDTVVLALEGEADLATAPEVGERLGEVLAARPAAVRVDLSELAFIDSTAVGVLLRCRRAAEASDVPFDLICPEGPARRVLSLLGLLPVFGLAAIVA